MLRLVYRPTRLPSLVAPHPPSVRLTSMPPPVGGAVPASTVISVSITSVTCAAVRSGRYNDDDGPVVVNAVGSGSGNVACENSTASNCAASLANRIAYSQRSDASEVSCTSTSRTIAAKFACREGAATCTASPGSTSLAGRQSIDVGAEGSFMFFTTLRRPASDPTLWEAMLFASCTRAIARALARYDTTICSFACGGYGG